MTNLITGELEPCPLCNSPAEGYYDGDYYADNEFSIRCTNTSCRLLLPADGYVSDGDGLKIDSEYVERWNTRKGLRS